MDKQNMEYLHNGLLFSYKVPKHTTWVHLENIMLNEKSQDTYLYNSSYMNHPK